jgi:hypothetical protein
LNSNPKLPRSTLDGMLQSLPIGDDLRVEQGLSSATREAIVTALEARDGCQTDQRLCLALTLTVVGCAAVFAILFANGVMLWLSVLAVVPVVFCVRSRRRRVRTALDTLMRLYRTSDFDRNHYRGAFATLDWTHCGRHAQARLLDVGC